MSRTEVGPPAEGVGDRIRRLRLRAGWDQAALGARVGVGRVAVANWETGKHKPAAEHLPRIAAVLGVTVDYVLSGDAGAYRTAFRDIAAIVDRVRAISPAATVSDEVESALDGPAEGGGGAGVPRQSRRA